MGHAWGMMGSVGQWPKVAVTTYPGASMIKNLAFR